MVRQKHAVWDHFGTRDGELSDKVHKKAWCNYCLKLAIRMKNADEDEAVKVGAIPQKRNAEDILAECQADCRPYCGKVDVMLNHILDCKNAPDNVKKECSLAKERRKGKKRSFEDSEDSDDEPDRVADNSAPLRKKQKPGASKTTWPKKSGPQHQFSFTVVKTAHRQFDAGRQRAFEAQLTRAFVSAGWAFRSIEDPEVRKLFEEFLPEATLPDRKKLGGSLLQRAVGEVEESSKERLSGKYATLQSDGWKNIRKNSLLAYMLACNGEVRVTHVHDISRQRKTADNYLKLTEEEIEYNKTLGVITIGTTSDAGGDSRAHRVRLLVKQPWLLMADCYAHQIQLNLGDYIKANPLLAGYISMGADVVKWFTHHSVALGILDTEQSNTGNGAVRSLIRPVITRWTSHYQAIMRLLEVESAMRSAVLKRREDLISAAGKKKADKLKAEDIIDTIENTTFWRSLRVVAGHIEPLAIASNICQGANIRCDQVLLLFGKLYRTYSQADPDRTSPTNAILSSLETRWGKADQDLFISALFVNPFIRMKLFNTSVVPFAIVAGALRRLYKRVFRVETVPLCLITEAMKYKDYEEVFSLENWPVEELCCGENGLQQDNRNPIICWRYHETKQPGLAKLATLILSFVCNSVNCERLFSTMGNTHTKLRNRLRNQTVRDIAVVKLDIRRDHAQRGLAVRRVKRQFGKDPTAGDLDPSGRQIDVQETEAAFTEETESDVESGNEEEDLGSVQEAQRTGIGETASVSEQSFEVVREQLIQQLNDDEDTDPSIGTEIVVPASDNKPSKKIRVFFGTKTFIPLEDMFDYSIEKGWDEFWFVARRRTVEERNFLELLEKSARQAVQPDASGDGSEPIVVKE